MLESKRRYAGSPPHSAAGGPLDEPAAIKGVGGRRRPLKALLRPPRADDMGSYPIRFAAPLSPRMPAFWGAFHQRCSACS